MCDARPSSSPSTTTQRRAAVFRRRTAKRRWLPPIGPGGVDRQRRRATIPCGEADHCQIDARGGPVRAPAHHDDVPASAGRQPDHPLRGQLLALEVERQSPLDGVACAGCAGADHDPDRAAPKPADRARQRLDHQMAAARARQRLHADRAAVGDRGTHVARGAARERQHQRLAVEQRPADGRTCAASTRASSSRPRRRTATASPTTARRPRRRDRPPACPSDGSPNGAAAAGPARAATGREGPREGESSRRKIDEELLTASGHALTSGVRAGRDGNHLYNGYRRTDSWLQRDMTTRLRPGEACRWRRARSRSSASQRSRSASSGSSSPTAASRLTSRAGPSRATRSSASKATAGRGSCSPPPVCCSCSAPRSTGAPSRWRSSSASRSASAR